MLYGLTFAFLIALSLRFRLFDDSHTGALWGKLLSILVTIASLAGILGYFLFALYCGQKQDCNQIHPYIAFIPVRES